jgi:hypothetical protein
LRLLLNIKNALNYKKYSFAGCGVTVDGWRIKYEVSYSIRYNFFGSQWFYFTIFVPPRGKPRSSTHNAAPCALSAIRFVRPGNPTPRPNRHTEPHALSAMRFRHPGNHTLCRNRHTLSSIRCAVSLPGKPHSPAETAIPIPILYPLNGSLVQGASLSHSHAETATPHTLFATRFARTGRLIPSPKPPHPILYPLQCQCTARLARPRGADPHPKRRTPCLLPDKTPSPGKSHSFAQNNLHDALCHVLHKFLRSDNFEIMEYGRRRGGPAGWRSPGR